MSDKKREKIAIGLIGVTLIVCMLVVSAVRMDFDHVSKPRIVSEDVMNDASAWTYNIDDIRKEDDSCIGIEGWRFENGKNLDGNFRIGFYDEKTGSLIPAVTGSKKREDVNNAYGNGQFDYTNSGFYSRISEKKLDPSKAYYIVFILDNDEYYMTDVLFREADLK